jgi:hypothetical protein
MTQASINPEEIKAAVREHYGQRIQTSGSCC